MVAPFGLGQPVQMLLEGLGALPRGAVDTLQLWVALTAPPVGGGRAHELERRDELRGRHVRAAAEVGPDGFPGVRVHVVVGGQLALADLHHLVGVDAALEVDELQFVRLVGQLLAGVVERVVAAPGEPLAGLDDLLHGRLQRGQVVRGERHVDVEVVVEAVGDRRTDAQLGLRVQLLHGLGQHVRGGVPDDRATVLGVRADGDDLDVGLRGPGQVAQPALAVADHHGRARPAGRQPGRADRRARGRPGRHPDGSGRGTGCGRGHGEPPEWCATVPSMLEGLRGPSAHRRPPHPDVIGSGPAGRIGMTARLGSFRAGHGLHLPWCHSPCSTSCPSAPGSPPPRPCGTVRR